MHLESTISVYPFGMIMPGRSYDGGSGYRYGFNGMEKLDEWAGEGNVYDYGLRMYDSRIARMRSVDPRTSEYSWQTTYAYHRNSPITIIDHLGGGDNDDKFLNEKGELLYDDGFGDDTYILNETDYDEAVCSSGEDCAQLSKALRNLGVQAYSSSDQAAMSYGKEAFNDTQSDPDHLERGKAIFELTTRDGQTWYALGNKVVGVFGTKPGEIMVIDPESSILMLGGLNAERVRESYDLQYVIRRKYKKGKAPWAVEWGWMENPIVSEGWEFTKTHNFWRRSGFIHSHPPGSPDFSADKDGTWRYPIGGDVGYAIRGYDVYLIPTTEADIFKQVHVIRSDYFKGRIYYNIYDAMDKAQEKMEILESSELPKQ